MKLFKVRHDIAFDDEGFLSWDPLNVVAEDATEAIAKANKELIGHEWVNDEDGKKIKYKVEEIELVSVEPIADIDVL